MAILVVGSVAFDGIETPSGKVERVLGGAATYFSLAASYFTDVRVVGVHDALCCVLLCPDSMGGTTMNFFLLDVHCRPAHHTAPINANITSMRQQ